MDDPQVNQAKPPFAKGFGGASQDDQGPQVAPVGGKKEADVWGQSDKVAKEEGDEYWENYAREIELEKEIMELGGIEKVETGEVKLPEDVAAEMGIKPTVNVQSPIANVTNFSIRGVALSDDQITIGLTKPMSSGLRWLVEWFIYQLLKAHFLIKKVHGKIFRQKKETEGNG